MDVGQKQVALAASAKAKLDNILNSIVVSDGATKDKLLGATFLVLGKDGKISNMPAPTMTERTRPPLLWLSRSFNL